MPFKMRDLFIYSLNSQVDAAVNSRPLTRQNLEKNKNAACPEGQHKVPSQPLTPETPSINVTHTYCTCNKL